MFSCFHTHLIRSLLIALMLVLTACGSSRPVPPANAPTGAAERAAQMIAEPTAANDIPEPTVTTAPTEEPTPEPVAQGVSRSNPLPLGTELRFATWTITLTSVLRGEEAIAAIAAANQFNDRPAEGMTYLLATVQMQNIAEKQEAQDPSFGIDLRVTGERNVLYSRASLVTPSPIEGQLFPGGNVQGQLAFVVPADEQKLMFRVSESLSFDDEAQRFVAIDDGASITVDTALEELSATEIGTAKNAPAKVGDTVITDGWEVTITEVARGEQAAQLAKEANQFNDPAEPGMEYIAIKLRARSIGTDEADVAQHIDGSFVNITGEKNVVYDRPSVVAPEPQLDASLFPGGVTEGWEILSVATGEQQLVVIFEPLFSFGNDATRFIAVE